MFVIIVTELKSVKDEENIIFMLLMKLIANIIVPLLEAHNINNLK